MSTQRLMRWRLYLEDFGVQFRYITGPENALADALSRLPYDERQNPIHPEIEDSVKRNSLLILNI